MASVLGMSGHRARWLRRAAVLHDVGKLAVSSAILEKPAGLDEREWVEMRSHAGHTRAISAGSVRLPTSPMWPLPTMNGWMEPAIRSLFPLGDQPRHPNYHRLRLL
jgi:hypothetical protein